MFSKTLSAIGAAALLLLVGGSAAALFTVQRRLHITVAEEEAANGARGPTPIDAVAEEVGAVRNDLRAFASGLGPQLEALVAALDESADARSAALQQELAATRGELAKLQADHARLVQSQQSSRDELRALQAAVAASAGAIGSAAPVASAAVAPSEVAPPPAAPLDPPAVVESPAPAAPAAAPRKKGFLRFDLPSDTFAFDRRSRFSVVPSLSRVGFDAKSTLHDFSGATAKVEGDFTTALATPGVACSGRVVVDAASLNTGLEGRDEAMRDHLAVADHAQIVFEWNGFDEAVVDAKAQTVKGRALGKLSIRGVTREVAMPVQVTVDASRRVAIEGQLAIELPDYEVPVPSQLGVIGVDKTITLWIALRARCEGPAEEAK
ncbi:MAG: YceI family protein [Planctomycetes bacterium]|nr:YceI family protein [Planctomycetota bacterium]